METVQPTKQNNMAANINNYKVPKNEQTTNEDKNKQLHSQIKIHNEHLKNITKIDKVKQLNMIQVYIIYTHHQKIRRT